MNSDVANLELWMALICGIFVAMFLYVGYGMEKLRDQIRHARFDNEHLRRIYDALLEDREAEKQAKPNGKEVRK